MGVRESLLNTITSVADSDFVRVVTSAGASSKATVRNLFKGFESNLGAKSSLTTSDYIRVVGSDNESYKQSFSDVVDQTLSAYPGLYAAADITAWAAERNGFGMITTNTNTANLPSVSNKYGVAWCNNGIHGTNAWCNLFWSPTETTDIYVCQKTNAGAWSSWEKLPTRAEIDALKNTTTGSFILDSAQSGATSSLVIKQCGKVVSVNGFITGLTLTSSTYIGKISGVSNPASYLRLYANVGWNAYSPGTVSYLTVDTDGSIGITTSETGSNKAVYFSLTYIAA